MAVQRHHRRTRRSLHVASVAGAVEGEARVRDHHHAIEAATRDFERWTSSTTIADRCPADQIRAALKAMLFPS